jgi:hypothetical protein
VVGGSVWMLGGTVCSVRPGGRGSVCLDRAVLSALSSEAGGW